MGTQTKLKANGKRFKQIFIYLNKVQQCNIFMIKILMQFQESGPFETYIFKQVSFCNSIMEMRGTDVYLPPQINYN